MKKKTQPSNKKKARALLNLIRNIGNGLSQQYDELAVTERAEQKP